MCLNESVSHPGMDGTNHVPGRLTCDELPTKGKKRLKEGVVRKRGKQHTSKKQLGFDPLLQQGAAGTSQRRVDNRPHAHAKQAAAQEGQVRQRRHPQQIVARTACAKPTPSRQQCHPSHPPINTSMHTPARRLRTAARRMPLLPTTPSLPSRVTLRRLSGP